MIKTKRPEPWRSRIRVLVVDDHELIRRGVRELLGMNSKFETCGEAINGEEAVSKAKELDPDVVILDMNMPVMNGMQAAREIRRVAPATKIMFLTMYESPQFELEARLVGADAIVTKGAVADSLLGALDRLFDVSSSATDHATQDSDTAN